MLDGSGPRWTMAPPDARGTPIPNTPKNLPVPVSPLAGTRRLSRERPRPTLSPVPPPKTRTEKINGDDIKLLNGPNFTFLYRQNGIRVISVTLEALQNVIDEAPTIELLDLPEQFFEDLLTGRVITW